MENFDFVALYSFLQSVVGMVLAFLGGRRSGKRKTKGRPHRQGKRPKC